MAVRFPVTAFILLLSAFALSAAVKLPVVRAESKLLNVGYVPTGEYVDLVYLIEHIRMFEGVDIVTNGTVRFYASIYMFEDFWLEASNKARIPAVVRFAGLPDPPEGQAIEVSGKIAYSFLEGGFYFLNVTSWKITNASSAPSLPPTQSPPEQQSPPTHQLEETPQETPMPQETTPQQEEDETPSSSPEPTGPSNTPLYIVILIMLIAIIVVATALFLKNENKWHSTLK